MVLYNRILAVKSQCKNMMLWLVIAIYYNSLPRLLACLPGQDIYYFVTLLFYFIFLSTMPVCAD